MSAANQELVLALRGISKSFPRPGAEPLWVAKDIDLEIRTGETLALIGESGSGKSSLARIALGLLTPDAGEVYLAGAKITGMAPAAFRRVRTAMQPVFQDSSASFNPRRTIFQAMAQAQRDHTGSRVELQERIAEQLSQVGLRPGRDYLARYPHELSGGQRQRLAIARAIAMDPVLIIADEPLSGADVSIRGQILNLMIELREKRNVAYLFITHDISIARSFAHRVAVMHRGVIVEQGAAEEVIGAPKHEYTQRLISTSLDIGRMLTGV